MEKSNNLTNEKTDMIKIELLLTQNINEQFFLLALELKFPLLCIKFIKSTHLISNIFGTHFSKACEYNSL